MKIKRGRGTPKYGPGVSIQLSGDEVATAIDMWLVAKGVEVSGPRTVTVNGELCKFGEIYVDPSGYVKDALGKIRHGNGLIEQPLVEKIVEHIE